MTSKGIDIAWDRPTVAQIKATGATWVARYFSTDATKNLRPSEVRDYVAAGLGIVSVWETTTGRATQGYQAGIDDANLADGQRKADGLPAEMVIHFAVDEDTDWASVAPYFNGAAQVIGKDRVGVYGGIRVINGAAVAGYRFLWQADAWSNGQWSPHATIRQTGGTTLAGGADYDTAEVADFGQYPRPTEVDMPLNDADGELVAKHVVNCLIPNQFNKDAAGHPVPTPLGTYLQYGDKHYADVMGMLASVKLQNQETQAALAKAGTPQLTDAQVQALATQVAPVLEQLLVPALLAAVGHALDGTQPPAKH